MTFQSKVHIQDYSEKDKSIFINLGECPLRRSIHHLVMDHLYNYCLPDGHVDVYSRSAGDRLCEMRAQVTELLRDRQTAAGDRMSEPPHPTDEVLLVNELIREYLEWNGYLYTASVMSSEAALAKEKKRRSELCADVGVKDDEKSSSLPLLSNIVAAYTERIRRKINKSKKEEA